ncbi:MAG TPA: phospholipase D-like domain-containing protein [Rhizomicrobium sp.]|nr:phospholipase D-like domain-containing protein [Rhizomicrobium sp.]
MFPTWIGGVWPLPNWLWTVAYVALAGLVTADVLLKKSDVRGALGWIGAVWLAPIIGSLLYYMFGINRVTRRALRLTRLDRRQIAASHAPAEPQGAVNIQTLAEVGRRVTGAPLAAGNSFSILKGGDEAYPAMLEAIRSARHSLAMASYIFRDDAAGEEFVHALRDAHGRGVQVRVLVDSVGTGYFLSPIYHRLKRARVPVARFLHTWLPWRMPFLNMRNHRKLLVADGRLAFMGGMNVGVENCLSRAPRDYVEDIHFRVEGPVVRSVMEAFARDWTFTTEETLDQDCWWPEIKPQGPVLARGLRTGPDADIYKLETLLGAALNLAKTRIRIVTPYFLPDQALQFAIAQAVMRGVKVDIAIPERSDHIYFDWAVRAHLRFFHYTGAQVYLSPRPFDHSKLVTLDGEWSLIGSSNWDTRSFRLNFEYDLECYDASLTAALDSMIDAKIAAARKLDYGELLRQPLAARLRDALFRLLVPYL